MIGSRYSGIIDNMSDYTFHILGCGAIGSSAATQLVRMGGTTFFLYDMMDVDKEVKATCAKPEYVKPKHDYSTGQLSMYHNTYGGYTSSDQTKYPPYVLVNEVDDLLKNVTLGKFDEKKFKKEVDKLNKELETKCEFKIATLSVPQIKDCMYYISGRDIIYHKDEEFEIEDLFDEDYHQWNDSFGAI